MERVKIDFSYLGKNFSGFQVQPAGRTVQGEVEAVLEKLFKEKVKIYASGRTDAGVSALHQVAHFDVPDGTNFARLRSSLNALLPPDISVNTLEPAGEGFDARFSVKKKTYKYFFYASKHTHALFGAFATRINDYADIGLMKAACKYFVGTHDFHSFVSRKSGKTNFTRTVFDAKIESFGEGLYAFSVTGDGFLYNMVRIMFGTLVSAGYKKIKPEEVEDIIEGKCRALAGKTMPAEALILWNVEYS